MKHVNKESDITVARENSGKNRNCDVVPSDANRVCLITVVSDRNDNINAVFLHVCIRFHKLISVKINLIFIISLLKIRW